MTRTAGARLGAGVIAGIALIVVLRGGLDYWGVGAVPMPCDTTGNGRADVALVLSGGPDYRRTRRAVALYDAGRVDRIVFSGAGHGGDSAKRLAREARRLGVSEDRIVIEPRARSTYDNFRFACALPALANARRVAIVTDQPHALRSYATAVQTCGTLAFCSAPAPLATDSGRRYSEARNLWAYQLLGRASWWW